LEEKKLKVTRDTILIPSTYEKMLTGSVAYIEVLFFGDHTKDEFQKSIEHVIHSGATSIILDFRNNG
jgi:C-terminal processing protease CtpA/Prc